MKLPKKSEPVIRGRIPFSAREEIGLGDVVKRLTSAVGVKPCDSCERRAAALNRYVVFSGRRQRD